MKTLTTSLLKSWFSLLPAALLSVSMVFTSCDKADVEPQKDNVSVAANTESNSYQKVASIPTIKCLSSTDRSITIEVKAGASGAPNGFTLQWKKDGEDWSKCQTKKYDICLKPYECKIICIENLECGKCYVFRASTNAFTLNGCEYACSPYSCEIKCNTKPCPTYCCTYTQGYWKNHADKWPTDKLYLGKICYSKEELLKILNTPVKGNGLVSLAHQLITAKLNVKRGSDPSICKTIDAADAKICDLRVPPCGNGYLHPSVTGPYNDALATYNEANHCN